MNYKQKLNNIKHFVFDIDGVLTDGIISVNSEGLESRNFNTKDGIVIKYAIKCGYKISIISGASNNGLKLRLNKLGIKDIFLGSNNKLEDLKTFISNYNLDSKQILYMGDDVSDFSAMEIVGLKCCPYDAASEIREISDYISLKKGGDGCVRDIIEQTLKVQHNWDINKLNQNF